MSDTPQRPRGLTGAEADFLRATVKSQPRPGGTPPAKPVVPTAPALPQAQTVAAAPEVERWVDEGREVLDRMTPPAEEDLRSAHAIFERAHRRNMNDPRAMSHYGLTLVLSEGDRQRGIRFCEEAVRRVPPTTEMLTNLARALVATRNKEQAFKALKKAQELSPSDPQVGAAFVALGLRRPPPLPFLPRSFFLNKWLGKLAYKLGRRRLNPVSR